MKQGDFCWNELMTTDVKKAKEFYKSLFGWEYEEHEMQHGTYTMLKSKENGGGMMQVPEDMQGKVPSHWLSYISVDDLKKSIEKALSLGAKIIMPETPAGDFGLFSIIEDPTGAQIALWQSLKSCD